MEDAAQLTTEAAPNLINNIQIMPNPQETPPIATQGAGDQSAVSSIEKEPRPTLVVPKNWGKGSFHEVYGIMKTATTDPDFAKQKTRLDAELRAMVEGAGIKIEERDNEDNRRINSEKNEYCIRGKATSEEIDQWVKEAVPDVQKPKAFTVEDLTRGDAPLPVVASFRASSGGEGKFLIETEEQRSKFLQFLEARGKHSKGLSSAFDIKEFINTPSDRYTSYRVLVSATGKILASGLLYSENVKSNSEYATSDADPGSLGHTGGDILDWLTVEKSPYYLRSRKFMSNLRGGGDDIPLNPTENSRAISEEERAILEQHGIGSDGKLPPKLADQASRIGASAGRKLGLMVGVDFIQDNQGNFYYLETNPEPGLQVYLDAKNNGVGDRNFAYKRAVEEMLPELTA